METYKCEHCLESECTCGSLYSGTRHVYIERMMRTALKEALHNRDTEEWKTKMKTYRVKNTLEITIWNTAGDHKEVSFPAFPSGMGECEDCGHDMDQHGFIKYEGMPNSPVCPGNYIVNGPAGPFAITKEFLEQCYEEVSK